MATPHPSRCTCDLPGRAGGGESTCQYPHPVPLTATCPRCGDTADRVGCDFCKGTGRVGSTIARAVGRQS